MLYAHWVHTFLQVGSINFETGFKCSGLRLRSEPGCTIRILAVEEIHQRMQALIVAEALLFSEAALLSPL